MISVIVNVYNGEKYITKCIDSIINQTYKDLEIIIVNDGSTDNTLDICKKYKDNRIKIITTKNMGLSLSRNIGIDNSKGEYIYFLDADDYIDPDTLEYLYKLSKKHKSKITTCDCIDIYDYNNNIKNKQEKIEILNSKEYLKKVLLLIGRNGTIWNKLIKRELLNNIRFEDRIVNDVVVVYKLILEAKKITYSNQIKYYYLRHEDSIMGKNKPDRAIDLYKASLERYEYIKKIYPNYIENEICLCLMIITLRMHNDKKVIEYLENDKSFELYKKLFSLKMLKCKFKKNDKIKLILFRINPKLEKAIIKTYIKLKRKRNESITNN